jgi:transposase
MVLTYRYRIKDATRRHLQRQAWAVNRVWNYCGETGGLARTSLAKSVLDAGWSQLRSQLQYKAIRHGAEYIEVDD